MLSEPRWRSTTHRPYPAPGDLLALGTVGRVLGERRDAASATHDQLAALGTANSGWEGEAADAFRASLGRLLPDLAKATDSFGRAADAITSFTTTLGGLQDRADALLPALQQAESSAHEDVLGTVLRLDPARTDAALGAVVARVDGVAHDYRAAVALCVSRIDAASAAGIHHTFGTWLASHEKGLEQISHWSGEIADWSGDAELALSIAALACSGTVAGAPAGLVLGGLAEVAGDVNKAASVVRLGSDGGLAVAQRTTDGHVSTEKKWDLAEDVLGFAPIGRVASKPLADGVAERQIAKHAARAEAALEADDMPAFWKAFGGLDRVDDQREAVEKAAESVIDKGVDRGFKAAREQATHETESAPCP